MNERWLLKTVARIETDFPEKFGIPRQSGLVETKGKIVFEKEFRTKDVIKEIEQYSHLWLIWGFSEHEKHEWKATVRPPRLGGNKRIGVFASRSPFRPNPIGLSCVRLERVEWETSQGPILWVSGVDMMSGTPIYDIKPYLPYVDSYPQAKGGFADEKKDYHLKVDIPEHLLCRIPEEKRITLVQILEQDVRPSYQHDEQRIYGMAYDEYEVKFRVSDQCVFVIEIIIREN